MYQNDFSQETMLTLGKLHRIKMIGDTESSVPARVTSYGTCFLISVGHRGTAQALSINMGIY